MHSNAFVGCPRRFIGKIPRDEVSRISGNEISASSAPVGVWIRFEEDLPSKVLRRMIPTEPDVELRKTP